MFHNVGPPVREFHCVRCQRKMHIYALVGFSLLFVVVFALSLILLV